MRDPGTGVIPLSFKVHAGSGTDMVWSLWIDDTASTNMVRWYGSGTSARGRVGSTTIVTAPQTLTGSWDDLLVIINPSAKTAAFFFNGAPIGTLDYSSQGTGNVIGRVRFERPGSSTTAGDYLSFDDLVLGEPAPARSGEQSQPGQRRDQCQHSIHALLDRGSEYRISRCLLRHHQPRHAAWQPVRHQLQSRRSCSEHDLLLAD